MCLRRLSVCGRVWVRLGVYELSGRVWVWTFLMGLGVVGRVQRRVWVSGRAWPCLAVVGHGWTCLGVSGRV